ncbi:hypothetical protein B0H11DRAFT_35957 [Mycena galericulata]|nr:hypothetical protein B0H11DRAFT_35957 [Mycena galericulata]
MCESDLLLDGHREQCTHTAEWDASCRNVMILSQILSTLERRPSRHHYPPRHRSYSSMRPALTPPVSRAQKLLTHFVNTLQYAPGEHGGAQVFAAINVGNVVSVIEDPVARSNENAQYSSGTSHAYHAVEVKTPRRSANDVVRNEIVPGGLTDHIGDIMVAVGQADEGPAQELVILRSLTWIRRRLNLLRFLKNPNPDSNTGPPFLSVLTSLRPPPDAGTVTIEVRTDVWDLSAQNQTATVTLSTFAVFQELETKVQDVLKYLQKYDLTTTKEARTRAFHPLTVSLMRLHFVARNPVFDGPDFFGSPQMEQIAQDLIHRSIEDDPLDIHDIGDDTRLGMRVLNAIRSITHPIRSMDVLLDSVLPKLIQAGALKSIPSTKATQLPPNLWFKIFGIFDLNSKCPSQNKMPWIVSSFGHSSRRFH